jgi:hypothetical protein
MNEHEHETRIFDVLRSSFSSSFSTENSFLTVNEDEPHVARANEYLDC